MKKIVVAVPHSHTWFWTQTCLACLARNPPFVEGYEVSIVVVDNSPWSPAIRGVTQIPFETAFSRFVSPFDSGKIDMKVVTNPKANKFHASALDHVVESRDCDLLLAMETDVLVLRPDWLQWFVDQLRPADYAVGAWHHEQFVNPSCTLYRGSVLRHMLQWCRDFDEADEAVLRWGPEFAHSQPIAARQPERDYRDWFGDNVSWIAGPFAEKRGWPQGISLKESPSGQLKGPGWYEPGQQLHHWAVEQGYTYTVCKTNTHHRMPGMPVQTLYGPGLALDMEQTIDEMVQHDAKTVHLWGGTRALDIIKHDVTCQFVKNNTPYWLAREARLWREIVPPEVQAQTLELIREHGWHITGQGTDHVSDRDRQAAEYVRQCYREGGVEW